MPSSGSSINQEVRKALAAKRPVISVDTKKKELAGNYENAGRQWRRAKSPAQVKVHDFPTPAVPRANPYGIYDLGRNSGFVNTGTDHDTGEFAVASIRGWWRAEGRHLYRRARSLLITADGGSNGYRLRLWKLKLQEFVDEARITVQVRHFPAGTSKWNKVEHRLFSFISTNWRGEPLRDYETIVRLEVRDRVADAVDRLPPRSREATILTYQMGYTHAEAARTMAITGKGVEKALRRARRDLRGRPDLHALIESPEAD